MLIIYSTTSLIGWFFISFGEGKIEKYLVESVKLFKASDIEKLENKINDYLFDLERTKSPFFVKDIRFQHTNGNTYDTYCAMILLSAGAEVE